MPGPGIRRRLRSLLAAGTLRLLGRLLGRLPWHLAQACGGGLGALVWRLSRRERRRTLKNLAGAFPDLGPAGLRELGRLCFRHHGTSLAECLHLLSKDCSTVEGNVEVQGWGNAETARQRGAVIILTGHCGNWELLAAAINCRKMGMAVVARALDDPRLQDLLLTFRRRFGTPTIARGGRGAARKLLHTLRQGGALGVLIDQDTRVDSVWVPFFGRPAATPVGAAEIALRQGASVVPGFIERRADGSHLARFLPALELPEDATAATAVMSRLIEEQVRRRPEQWVWMHRRWRRPPPGAAA